MAFSILTHFFENFLLYLISLAATSMGASFTSLFVGAPPQDEKPKVILITGASSGMGHDMAATMIQRGHIVYGTARRLSKMQDLVNMGGFALEMDVTKYDQVKRVVDTILAKHGRIDVLVNNAGAALMGAIEDISMEKAKQLFDVDFFGIVNITKEVMPSMRERKSGLIVNISSVLGQVHRPLQGIYCAAKSALEGWSDCLRVEMKVWDVDVVIFEPGLIKTEIIGDIPTECRKGGPYEPIVRHYEEKDAKALKYASPTSVVTDKLVEVVDGKRQRRSRYVMGFLAAPLIWARKNLGDGFMDMLFHYVLTEATKKDS